MSKTTALDVHHAFDYISLTFTARLRRQNSQCDVSWRTWTYYVNFSLRYLNMDKALKNSTPGKVAYIRRIERFQIDAIKFERTQIHFFHDIFTAVVRRRCLRSLLFSIKRQTDRRAEQSLKLLLKIIHRTPNLQIS